MGRCGGDPDVIQKRREIVSVRAKVNEEYLRAPVIARGQIMQEKCHHKSL